MYRSVPYSNKYVHKKEQQRRDRILNKKLRNVKCHIDHKRKGKKKRFIKSKKQ